MGSLLGPKCGSWMKWSITKRASNPAASARRAISAVLSKRSRSPGPGFELKVVSHRPRRNVRTEGSWALINLTAPPTEEDEASATFHHAEVRASHGQLARDWIFVERQHLLTHLGFARRVRWETLTPSESPLWQTEPRPRASRQVRCSRSLHPGRNQPAHPNGHRVRLPNSRPRLGTPVQGPATRQRPLECPMESGGCRRRWRMVALSAVPRPASARNGQHRRRSSQRNEI